MNTPDILGLCPTKGQITVGNINGGIDCVVLHQIKKISYLPHNVQSEMLISYLDKRVRNPKYKYSGNKAYIGKSDIGMLRRVSISDEELL